MRACVALWMAVMPLSEVAAFEQVELHLDERKWQPGHKDQQGNQTIMEFVLEGESVENWTELVTVQLFEGKSSGTLAEWIDTFKKGLALKTKNLSRWNIIRNSAKDSMFEWAMRGDPSIPDQYEIVRLIKGDDGIHMIHYAIKKPEISSGDRTKWMRLLDSARIR